MNGHHSRERSGGPAIKNCPQKTKYDRINAELDGLALGILKVSHKAAGISRDDASFALGWGGNGVCSRLYSPKAIVAVQKRFIGSPVTSLASTTAEGGGTKCPDIYNPNQKFFKPLVSVIPTNGAPLGGRAVIPATTSEVLDDSSVSGNPADGLLTRGRLRRRLCLTGSPPARG